MIGLLAFLLVFSTGSMIFIKNFYDGNFPRYDEKQDTGYLHFRDVPNYSPTIVHFQSGSNTLAGYLYGEGNQKGLVVIAAGRGGGAETYLPETIYFVDHGWRVFSFDYTGSFASEGSGMKGLPQSRLDLRAALSYSEKDKTFSQIPVMLYGHSWGGYAVTAVLNDDHDISAVASISGFNSPMGLLYEQSHVQIGPLATVEYPFGWAYQAMLFGKDAFVTAVDGINSTDIPIMVIHGTADEAIAYNGASIIAQRKNITNPNVIYKAITAENKNNHDQLFKSDAAVQYIAAKNEVFRELKERYHGDIPAEGLAQFYSNIDRFQTSELDTDFMKSTNTFFENALPKSR